MAKNGSSRWWKWVILLALAGGAIAGGIWYYNRSSNSTEQYQIVTISRGDLTQAVSATGQLNPVLNVQVGSQISGRINKLYVDYNSQVKSNQVIAEIDPSSYQSTVLRAQAEVANARANLALAQVQSRRAASLFTNNLISASDYDTTMAQEKQADAQIKSAEANLANAQVDLSRCTIYAPVDGVVISRNVDVGQTVAASFNTPTLFLIANDLGKMQIDALVSEADIGGVTIGQTANFSVDAYPYRTFHGKISQIRYGAITNQNVVNYDCVISVANEDLKLLPGMTATISIVLAQRDNVLKVPNSAFRFKPPEVVGTQTNKLAKAAAAEPTMQSGGPGAGGAGRNRGGPGGGGPGNGGPGGEKRAPGAMGTARPRPERAGPRTVYVVTGGSNRNPVLKPVQVKTGISDGVNTEIIEGLNEGDQIVTGLIATSSGSAARPSSPFGGGFRRF